MVVSMKKCDSLPSKKKQRMEKKRGPQKKNPKKTQKKSLAEGRKYEKDMYNNNVQRTSNAQSPKLSRGKRTHKEAPEGETPSSRERKYLSMKERGGKCVTEGELVPQ